MQSEKANIERMVETVPDSEWESMQHFISNSPWDHQGLIAQLAKDANQHLGGTPESYLLIDESAFSKKGRSSVGVARQWNGRLGKVDNCQVGVFGALGCRDKVTLTDMRLYLPKEWTDDSARCKKAGVPEEAIVYRTKSDLALEIVDAALKNQLDFSWVGADSFYGRNPAFRQALAAKGLVYMVDIFKGSMIYLEAPQPYLPAREPKKGRPAHKLKTDKTSCQVGKWLKTQPEHAFTEHTIRQGTKGPMKARVLHRIVWLWDGKSSQAEQVHLLVAITGGHQNQRIKYSVSNAPLDTPLEKLFSMQAQRYWIERALQDGKSEAGMADYQVRGWTAWHHHMAMVMLAMLFMLQTKIKYQNQYELLSTADVRILLQHFLPKRKISIDDIVKQMYIRHHKRRKDIHLNRKT